MTIDKYPSQVRQPKTWRRQQGILRIANVNEKNGIDKKQTQKSRPSEVPTDGHKSIYLKIYLSNPRLLKVAFSIIRYLRYCSFVRTWCI